MEAVQSQPAAVEHPGGAPVESQDPQHSQALQTHLAQAREKLDALTADLRAVDAQLAALAPARERHRLLAQACDALDGLRSLDAAQLFWGEDAGAARPGELMGRARGRLETFALEVQAVEDRRGGVLAEMAREQERSALLEDDLFEALEQEERRRLEWIIEREISAVRSREAVLPWSHRGEEDRRFRKSLTATLLASVLLAVLIHWIPLPVVPPTAAPPQIPQRVIALMMKRQPQPPPPRVQRRQPPPPPVKLAQQKPAKKPQPQQTVTPQPRQAVAKPVPQGLLAFSQKLAALQDAPVAAHLGRNAQLKSTVDKTALPQRAMLTTNAPGSSGGIRLAALSRGLGPEGGAERGAIKGGALTHATSGLTGLAGAAHPLSNGAGPGRTDEEIQIVFDRHKAELYRLYNLQLRKDPTLQGKMILRLTIEPDGSVSFCALQSTDMNAPSLAADVVARVKTFDFGAKPVPAITIVYPIDFLPAT